MINDGFRLLPEQASSHAWDVDLLYYFLLLMSTLFTIGIASSIVYFAIKYRRGNTRVDRTIHHKGSYLLEVAWMVIPLLLSLFIFTWAANLYFIGYQSPEDSLEIQAIGKQWMWKFQHPSGRRELNTLHVPLGRPVKVSAISQDVIHSLFVPAFRVKRDVLPGRYETFWFEAIKTGEYHLFCAEYCGTNHSRMVGKVVVMDPTDFEAWLAGGIGNETPAEAGKRLFHEFRCDSCHSPKIVPVRAPPLENLFGQKVTLQNDQVVTADDDYLRESILKPTAKIVKGYQLLMPSFDGQLDEEQIMQLISYLKSLGTP